MIISLNFIYCLNLLYRGSIVKYPRMLFKLSYNTISSLLLQLKCMLTLFLCKTITFLMINTIYFNELNNTMVLDIVGIMMQRNK
jgi:hypothetical protein